MREESAGCRARQHLSSDTHMHNCTSARGGLVPLGMRGQTGFVCLILKPADQCHPGCALSAGDIERGLVGWFPCCRGGRLSILWRSTPHPKVYVLHTCIRTGCASSTISAPRPRSHSRLSSGSAARFRARPKGRVESGRFAWAAVHNLIYCKLNQKGRLLEKFVDL